MDDTRLERIENKIDSLAEKLSDQNAILAGQHVSLREHMRRTALLEKSIKPLTKHVYYMQGALKLLGALALVAAVVEAVAVLVRH